MTSTVSKWDKAKLVADTVDPSDVVIWIEGQFAGNVGSVIQKVGQVFDVDSELAEEMVKRWNAFEAPAAGDAVLQEIKPLPWEKASQEHFDNGTCHGYEEEIAYVGKWDFFRIYPVSDGKWRWVRQFRGLYIDGNKSGEVEPGSAEEAKAAAWENWSAYLSSFLAEAASE
jgi:hypothetical protein